MFCFAKSQVKECHQFPDTPAQNAESAQKAESTQEWNLQKSRICTKAEFAQMMKQHNAGEKHLTAISFKNQMGNLSHLLTCQLLIGCSAHQLSDPVIFPGLKLFLVSSFLIFPKTSFQHNNPTSTRRTEMTTTTTMKQEQEQQQQTQKSIEKWNNNNDNNNEPTTMKQQCNNKQQEVNNNNNKTTTTTRITEMTTTTTTKHKQ